MGCFDIQVTAYGETMGSAFDTAVNEATFDHGHDTYNGTISTIDHVCDKTTEFNELGKEKWCERAVKETDKREAWGAKIGEGMYIFVGWAAC